MNEEAEIQHNPLHQRESTTTLFDLSHYFDMNQSLFGLATKTIDDPLQQLLKKINPMNNPMIGIAQKHFKLCSIIKATVMLTPKSKLCPHYYKDLFALNELTIEQNFNI